MARIQHSNLVSACELKKALSGQASVYALGPSSTIRPVSLPPASSRRSSNRVKHPPTPCQRIRRFWFWYLVSSWRYLSTAQKLAWRAFALATPFTNPCGAIYFLSAYRMFVKVNGVLLDFGVDYMTLDPPADYEKPASMISYSLSFQPVTYAADPMLLCDVIPTEGKGISIWAFSNLNPLSYNNPTAPYHILSSVDNTDPFFVNDTLLPVIFDSFTDTENTLLTHHDPDTGLPGSWSGPDAACPLIRSNGLGLIDGIANTTPILNTTRNCADGLLSITSYLQVNQHINLTFRRVDIGSGYRLAIYEANITLFDLSTGAVLGGASIHGYPCFISVSFIKDIISVYANDVLQFTVNSTTSLSGFVGVNVYAVPTPTGNLADDFELSALNGLHIGARHAYNLIVGRTIGPCLPSDLDLVSEAIETLWNNRSIKLTIRTVNLSNGAYIDEPVSTVIY